MTTATTMYSRLRGQESRCSWLRMKFWRGTPSPAAESLPAIREQKHGRPIEVAEHGKIKDFASTSGQLVGPKSGSEGLFGYLTAVATGSPKEMISNLDQLLATFGGVECISPWDAFRAPSTRTNPGKKLAERCQHTGRGIMCRGRSPRRFVPGEVLLITGLRLDFDCRQHGSKLSCF
jgi:hypothetical protein